jgi:hypothetical protein
MTIRYAASDDARVIGELLSAAFVEFEAHYNPDRYAATILTLPVIQARIESAATEYICVVTRMVLLA